MKTSPRLVLSGLCSVVLLAFGSASAAPPASDFSSQFKPRLSTTPAPAGAPAAAAASPTGDILALASDPFLIKVLYDHPTHLGSEGNASGAVSVNAQWEADGKTPWFIEQQRYGVDHITAGVVLKNPAMIEKGIRITAWGFAHQGPDGDFPGTGDPVHSTSLFLEAAARATLLLKQSKMPAYEAQAKEWTPKVAAAARWLAREGLDPKKRKNSLDPYTHRFYIRAAALGEAAALTGEKALADTATIFAREGLAKQLPDGTNPEKGGFDVSYQMVGLCFAMCYENVCTDPALKQGIKTMATKALANALTKVGPDGTVSMEGSTRVGQEESRSGVVKTLDYKNLLQGLIFADRLTGEAHFREAAQRIAKGHGWL
jgi:hypothetical protein